MKWNQSEGRTQGQGGTKMTHMEGNQQRPRRSPGRQGAGDEGARGVEPTLGRNTMVIPFDQIRLYKIIYTVPNAFPSTPLRWETGIEWASEHHVAKAHGIAAVK